MDSNPFADPEDNPFGVSDNYLHYTSSRAVYSQLYNIILLSTNGCSCYNVTAIDNDAIALRVYLSCFLLNH